MLSDEFQLGFSALLQRNVDSGSFPPVVNSSEAASNGESTPQALPARESDSSETLCSDERDAPALEQLESECGQHASAESDQPTDERPWNGGEIARCQFDVVEERRERARSLYAGRREQETLQDIGGERRGVEGGDSDQN